MKVKTEPTLPSHLHLTSQASSIPSSRLTEVLGEKQKRSKSPEEHNKKSPPRRPLYVLGVKKTVKTPEERRRLSTPSERCGNRRGTHKGDKLLATMHGMPHGGADTGGRSGV
ncbi:hypothetical protein N7517_004041 [Penicillium concentricum]|uniref:Uncharacterized protein n=1 Tax=Penicillium concentricum TaxID=293559 RepID=A0A9W9S531_9EURO|nr:uncharacterized protein N7517_004041 [Penicillium concentricum]KAJ5372035.1 hypothetical protein N7517_004041 [Penicillium concentricum]